MCWYSISTKGELAKVLAAALGQSVEKLDEMDGDKNGEISPFTLKGRLRTEDRGCTYGGDIGIVVIDNGDGKIDANDVVVVQSWKGGDIAFIGGTFLKLMDGYERPNGKKVTEELSEANKARSILTESNRRKITLFTDFKEQADDIIKQAFSR